MARRQAGGGGGGPTAAKLTLLESLVQEAEIEGSGVLGRDVDLK